MDEKVFLGCKAIVGREDSWLEKHRTVIETCCANNTMLPPMASYQGKGLVYTVPGSAQMIMQTKLQYLRVYNDKGFPTNEGA